MRRIRSSGARLGFLALAAVVMVAGCSSAGQSIGTAKPTGARPSAAVASLVPSDRSTRGSSASPPAAGGSNDGLTATASVADARGDVAPGYLDIVRVDARAQAGQLDLSVTLSSPVPASSVTVGTLEYAFSLDTDGDGTADSVASLENVPEGGFRPVLTDPSTGRRLEGSAFPGTSGLAGREVTLSLPLDAIGCPATVAIRASSARTHNGVTDRDEAPDSATGSLTVSGGC